MHAVIMFLSTFVCILSCVLGLSKLRKSMFLSDPYAKQLRKATDRALEIRDYVGSKC